ncbi:MAG: aldehyde dehydrogenase [Syntrophomonadaceae bacterium]|nr:aldehyde dehydrogenase [Syntrophomonadaceae bacterium]
MEVNQKFVEQVTAAVLAVMAIQNGNKPIYPDIISGNNGLASNSCTGVFNDVDNAVEAARTAYYELAKCSIEKRGEMIEAIRNKIHANVTILARMELEETGFGRYEHKVKKFYMALEKTPGIEDVMPQILSGDLGMTIIEYRSFGIAACITPSTAPAATVVHNAMCMIAAGNTAVISAHPNAVKTTIKAVELVNEAISEINGVPNTCTVFTDATIENAGKLMNHPKIDMIVATGGPAVVKAALSCGKKAIGAGAGNPPCLVDETADIKKAAQDIVNGNSNENGINCLGEKSVIAVESIADALIQEMCQKGAYLIKDKQIDDLMQLVTLPNGKPNVKYVGKNACLILKDIGINVDDSYRSIIFEAPADHELVMEEYLMPILPIVRIKNFDSGAELAMKIEGHRRHTAVIHSKNIDHMTRYAKMLSTTILVKNGSSYNGAGIDGEGHMTMTIAGPTGDGLTTPRTFTRPMRCALIGNVGLRGAL